MGLNSTSPFARFAERLGELSPLSDDDHAALRGLGGAIIQARAGTDLVPPGDKAAHVHLVVEGLVGRFAQFRNGKRQITAMHLPSDIADLHAVARPMLAPALQALATTTLVRIPIAEVAKMARSSPATHACGATRDCRARLRGDC